MEMRLLALTQGGLSLWSPKGRRALRGMDVPSHRNLQAGHSQTPWRGPVGHRQWNNSVLIPQSSCQGSSSTKVLQDVTEHPCTILGTGHSLVRRTSGSAPEEVASSAPCSPQDTSGSPVPGPWGGSSGDRADTRPGSVGVWHESSCPCSALRQGAKKSLN